MDFYVARDDRGLHYFEDCPDLVKFNPYVDDIEWTGYKLDFGKFDKKIKAFIEDVPEVQNLEPFDAPVHISIIGIECNIL